MKRAVVVLLLLIANAVFGEGTKTTPETAPGKLFQEWLTAFNRADGDALRKFAETRYTPEARTGRSPSEIADSLVLTERKVSSAGTPARRRPTALAIADFNDPRL